jgi:hypothetical protein
MTKPKDAALRRTPTVRRVFVAESDVAAAHRLLSAIAAGDDPSYEPKSRAGESREGPDRRQALAHAEIVLALRERRVRMFEGSFSPEAPFALLLALYVHEAREPDITMTRLTQLAWIGNSTTIRWLEVLVEQGWLERRDDPADKRQIFVSLSAKARDALDELFGWRDPKLEASS